MKPMLPNRSRLYTMADGLVEATAYDQRNEVKGAPLF